MKKQTFLAVSMMTLLLSAAVPFASMAAPAYADTQAQSAPEPMKKLAQLDKNVVEAAKQAMQKEAGSLPIELDEITGMNADCWVISAKDSRGEVLVTKKEGTVVSVHVNFKFSEVATDLQNTIMNTLKSMDSTQAFTFDKVDRFSSDMENSWVFKGENVTASIDAKTGKPSVVSIKYSSQKVNPKVVDTAQKAMKALSNGKASALHPEVSLLKNSDYHLDQVWSFMDRGRTYSVFIGAKTGKAVSAIMHNEFRDSNYVSDEDIPKAFAKPFYTKEKAIAAANPMVKKVFHMDLTGYNVSTKYNEYTFTKKGKPTVTASINKKGVFYDFTVTPENGMIN
ncbi:hypothetical protein GPJ61_16550 [Brevibacillus formosus]|uniref:hypothetical protein n=1 Tax=Brevibacillus formosus TaxID=54913 RepID=UPI001CA5D457|nr:hypothetical protein [Brevibacillus formosus]MBW5469470.1 hypothetical protein [Brevibacillus formosus]